MDLIKIAKEAFATDVKREMEFNPGDTITVAYKIIEGTKGLKSLERKVDPTEITSVLSHLLNKDTLSVAVHI